MTPRVIKAQQIDEILALASAEAERRGHRRPGVAHVAYAMASAFRREFEVHFGRFGRMLLDDLLRSGISPGGIRRATSILATADSIDDALRVLHDYLAFPEVMTHDMELEAHERWLRGLTEDRLRAYDRRRDNTTLDELYVLIATLKIAGLEGSYIAMKEQLVARRAS